VKLIRTQREKFVLEISRQEKNLLCEVLNLYPLTPATHYHLSKTAQGEKQDENQRLLEESLAAQREENQKNVQAILNEPGHFQTTGGQCQLTLSWPETEWLLQVLNDVRVGSWIALGSPDTETDEEIPLNDETAPRLRSMELAGAFEMVFLNALTAR
jgi:hypothetical protein